MARSNIQSNSQSIEAQAVRDLSGGNGSVLTGSEHLPGRGSSSDSTAGSSRSRGGGSSAGASSRDRAGHEAGVVGPLADGVGGGAGGVDERSSGRAGGDVAGVGDSESQGTGGLDVDLLAAGDDDILDMLELDWIGGIGGGRGLTRADWP